MCAKPFSRRWNRDRHLREIHSSGPFSPSFASPRMNYEASRLNFNTSSHLRFHSNSQAHKLDKNPINRTLEILRKIAEIKRLKEEISFMPNQESYHLTDPINRTLEILRKIAEIKRLKEEISFMPNQESYHLTDCTMVLMDFHLQRPTSILILFDNLKSRILELIGYNGKILEGYYSTT